MDWAEKHGIVCNDERFLHSEPYPTKEDWCAARLEEGHCRIWANVNNELVRRAPGGGLSAFIADNSYSSAFRQLNPFLIMSGAFGAALGEVKSSKQAFWLRQAPFLNRLLPDRIENLEAAFGLTDFWGSGAEDSGGRKLGSLAPHQQMMHELQGTGSAALTQALTCFKIAIREPDKPE